MRFPDVAGSVLHLLCDFLSDTNTASALDVIYFIREIIQVRAMGVTLQHRVARVCCIAAGWLLGVPLGPHWAGLGSQPCRRPCALLSPFHAGPCPPPPLLTAALAPLQTNPKLHDTIIERLMDTFPAVRASRVASCALWIISEYCTRRWGLPRGRVVVVVACSRRAGGQAGRQRGREPPARIPPPCCLLLPTVRLPPAQRRGDFRCRGDDQGVPGAAAAVQGARGG